MKKFFTLLALMLLCSVGAWADGIQKYTPTNRVTELQDGHSYIVYFAGLPSGQDRTGVVYERGGDQVGFYCSKKPHNGFNTTSNRFLWTVTAASDANGYYLQNVGTSKYVGSDGRANKEAASKPEVYIYQWKADGVESAGVDVESATGTRVANASSSFDSEKVWIVKNNASEYWHANVGSFTTWSSGHPVAFYEYTTETVETVDYTITFAGTGTGTVKCGEEVLTNGQTYTSSKLLSSSDITVEGCNYSVIIDDINMIVTVNLYGLPKISTSSEKFYYTLKDTKGRNRYAYYNGDDQFLGTDGAAGNDNRYFYFTQSAAQVALSTNDYKVVSIHNIAAGNKEMTAMKSWGATETNWYIKLSPKVSDANYIAVCPNSSFGGDSWNDYSTNIQGYNVNDNNSAWEFAPVSLVEYTVQVLGLPSATDLAGVTVYGANYNNGAKVVTGHRDPFFAAMTAMEVPGYTACVTGYNNNLRVAYTEKIKASAAPDNGEWAANTTWYYIKSKNSNGYISNGSAYKQDANFKFNNTTKPTDADGLWALVYNEETGTYKIYNKNAGTNSVMAHNATTDNSPVYLANSTDAANSDFIFEPGVQAGTYCIRINGTTNARWNNRTYLSTWTSNDSFYGGGSQAGPGGWGAGATGSQYVFEVYVPEETASLPNSWNNYTGENQTEWTLGTNDIVTANTANKASHYYHDWDFQTATHSGSVTLRFQYGPTPNGSARLDISCVELLNADGTQVLSSDVHNGYTGGQQSNRDYTIKVPAKNTAYKLRVWSFDTRNSHGTITYMNWGDVTASEFEVATAKEIMSDGVGYPKASTSEYTTLAELTAGTITKDVVTDAKNAYMICADVNMPEDGKAYKLKLVTPAGSSRYITYSAGSALAFTETANDNSVYLCKAVGDKYIFITKDGNILTWMGGADGYLNGGSRKGYSNMYPAIQNDKEDWNLFTCRKQNNAADQLGLVRLAARRKATDLSSLVCQFSNWTWSNANESPFWENTSTRKFSTGILMEEVEGITAATAGYADGVEKYNLYNTAVENNTTYASYFGEGLGKYHYTDKEGAVQTTGTGYMAAVKACTTLDQERTVVPVEINQPEAGKFYAFKAVQRNKYLANTAGANGLLETEAKNDAIFYLTEGESEGQVKLLSYKNGQYASGTGLAAVGSSNYFTIEQAKNASAETMLGQYALITNESHHLCMWENGYVKDHGQNYNDWEGWTIEEVESLPVTIASSGYTTFYAPVDIQVPAGTTAYAATVDEEETTITYSPYENNIIPAAHGAMLKGTPNAPINLVPTTGADDKDSHLVGYEATHAVSQNVGMYIYTLQSGMFQYFTGSQIPGFKAYLLLSQDHRASSGNSNFRVVFEDGIVTGIEAVESSSSNEIFDLQGRRVNNAQKGLYIVNGRKVLR